VGYGLIDIGAQTRQQAMKGMQDAADREQVRESANDQLKAAEKQQQMSSIGMGAATGAMAGAQAGSVGGPAGAAIGAAAGFVLSKLF